jgi:glucuronokinase
MERPGKTWYISPALTTPGETMIIATHAYARAGLVGNPSDGYFGKTISIVIRNFKATVRLWESPHFEIVPTHGDFTRFDSVNSFVRDIRLHGYYGGMRLIKATVKRFHDYFAGQGKELHNRNFTIEFETDIPRLVGMSGSSAIVVATMRALMQFYDVSIPKEYLPTLALSAEKDELGINAGLQDRVIQTYEGIVYMDFDKAKVESTGHGVYEPLKPPHAPPLYVAYDPERAEVSDIPHRNLRALFNSGDKTVVEAMAKFRDLTDRGKAALLSADWRTLAEVTNANFDLRRTIMPIAPENLRMVEVARSVGASAKFAGSGGAIIGVYQDGRQYQELVDKLASIRCTVLRPLIFDN